MQLVAYGAQDIYLTGNPQITFFKVVYRRHTNFSMEEIEQTPDGSVGFGNTASYTISRNGDLVHKMYFQFTPNQILNGSTTDSEAQAALNFGHGSYDLDGYELTIGPHVGHTLLKEIECEIGGQLIDKHYNHWLSTRSMLTEINPCGVNNELDESSIPVDGAGNAAQNAAAAWPANPASDIGKEPEIGDTTLYNLMSYNHKGQGLAHSHVNSNTFPINSTFGDAPNKAMVPLQFWFNRNPGLALPLIALQYHEVKIKITFAEREAIVGASSGAASFSVTDGANTLSSSGKLWAQYIYLDTDERRRFAQVSHEYLIEQLQFQNTTKAKSMELNFNHPVKELIWGNKPGDKATSSAPENITTTSGPGILQKEDTGLNYHLTLNGHERFAPRHHLYFSRQQINDHHTGFGGTVVYDSILVYSFALKPEEHQPSGTCNFSRIDTAELVASGVPGDDQYIYAINYNVLRIMSGMGGLAYSN